MWSRLSFAVSGSTSVRAAAAPRGAAEGCASASSTVELPQPPVPATAGTGASVITVLLGTTSTGRISAATCLASWRERWKNLGSTSCRFSCVSTLASSMTQVMYSRPSRSGSTISGNRSTRRVATCR
jgi:hypothetical protein